jgi:hypothetical protein
MCTPRREAKESQANDERGGARFIVRHGEVTEMLDMNLALFTADDEKPATEGCPSGDRLEFSLRRGSAEGIESFESSAGFRALYISWYDSRGGIHAWEGSESTAPATSNS